jgi:hypothetical protein
MSKLFKVRLQYGVLVSAETPEQAVTQIATAMAQNPYTYIFGAEVASFEAKPDR